MANFIGKYVSVDCGPHGYFQGQILKVSPEKLTLTKVFRNGTPASTPADLNREVIRDLKMIDVPINEANGINVERPLPMRQNVLTVTPTNDSTNVSLNQGQFKREKLKKRDKEAFGVEVASSSSRPDFDFEKNLALFDKKAVYDEINASRPDYMRKTDKYYRCTENVIVSEPRKNYPSQIAVPAEGLGKTQYKTDSGIVVPSITTLQRNKLFELARRIGLSNERISEIMGRAAVEMVLMQVGGSHRLQPGNEHQNPCVVVLCDDKQHLGAAFAINAARQLTTHGVDTVVYLSPGPDLHLKKELTDELQLYQQTQGVITSSVKHINKCAVDLIIVGGFVETNETTQILRWAQEHRAPVLGIDPPEVGLTGLVLKCSLVPCLPLSYNPISNGKIFLCNVPIPQQVFLRTGITFKPPFGAKFVLPVYPNDD